jgi:hypothetical protein
MSVRVLTGAIGDAYYIAADYLTKTGRLSDGVEIHQSLLNSIAADFQTGKTNKLLLANNAIARFEAAPDL